MKGFLNLFPISIWRSFITKCKRQPYQIYFFNVERVLRFSELFRNDLLFIVKLDSKKAHGLLVPVDSTWRSKARSTDLLLVSVPSFVNVNWYEPAAKTLQHTSLCCTVLVRFVKGARTTWAGLTLMSVVTAHGRPTYGALLK